MVDVQINAKFFECMVIELLFIIHDDNVGGPEVANGRLPKKGLDLAFRYMCRGPVSTHLVK